MSKQESYDDNSIQVLNDIEHIKLRYGMYISDNGPFQLFSEVLDNSLDEMGEGYGKEIIVNVDTKLNKYTVIDNGRGIPIGMKRLETGEEKETLEVICTKANSSGKFNTDSYKYSAGINGLGITITNALSKHFEITTMRGKKAVTFKANDGIKESLDYIDLPSERTGCITSFIPGDIFKDKKIPLHKIEDRCRVASALGYRVRLTVDGEEIDTNATIYDTISIYKELPLIHVINTLGEEMKVAIRYTSDISDRYFGYTNMLTNSSGGTHVNELSKTIISAWQEFIDKKKVKLEVDLKNSDYLVGIRAVCAIFISQPEFSSQTKEKLVVNKDRLKELMENFKDKFKEILYDNEELAVALIKRFEEYRIAQNKLLTNKDIMSKIKINTDDSNNIRRRSVSENLIECTSKKRENTELYIVEGRSASGPFIKTRNKETQAVLPLRGKILNVTNKKVKDAIKNKEVCDIANCCGAGIGANNDASKSRYEKIIISADADVDGLQITCLVLSVFVNLFPDMIKQGRVYLTYPPLYAWKTKNGFDGCMNIEDIPKDIKEYSRIKGLGEFNDDQVKYFLVDPETRYLSRIEFPTDIDKFNEILGTSNGRYKLMKSLGIIK